jgi:hypothetical protein
MRITKTTKEVWITKKFKDDEGIGSSDNNREMTVTYDVDINPDELPELVNNCIRAGLGDIKPILMEFLENIKKKSKY